MESKSAKERTRYRDLERVEKVLEGPMLALAVAWIALIVVELVRGLPHWLRLVEYTIWGVFVVDFIIRLLIAPRRLAFIRHNWLTALSLVVPALRIFRIFAFFRLFRVVPIVGSFNRAMHNLQRNMKKRGLPYVAALTLVVLFAGSAGMYAFEHHPGDRGLNDYPTALWWTAMMLTTIGTDYFPVTLEGRILCLFISLYALAMLGYIAATLAAFFLGHDAADPKKAPTERSIAELRDEIRELRKQLAHDHSEARS
ncbi:MAG: ion transporter [Gemmatimonadaceae bacterium]